MPIQPGENIVDFTKRLAIKAGVDKEAFEKFEDTTPPKWKPRFSIIQDGIKTRIESSLQKKDTLKNLSEKQLEEINTNREKPGKFKITGVKYLQDNITRDSIVFQIFLSAEKWKGSYEVRRKYTKQIYPNHQNIDDNPTESYHFEKISSIIQLNPCKIYVGSDGRDIISFVFFKQVFAEEEGIKMNDFINTILRIILQKKEHEDLLAKK